MAVRGTFDLNERPATEALRRLERQLGSTQRSLEATGKAVDGVFNEKQVAEAKAYEGALSSVERQSRSTFDSLSRNAREAEFNVVGSVRRMDSSVVLFRENLNSLSRTRATPSVDLDGVAEGIAQVELLERKLGSLGRQTASPNVNVRGAMGGGFGRVPTTGGGGSSFGGGLKVPFAGSVPYPLVGAALAAAPPLIGGAGALLGSAGGALLGAGALGITGIGVGGAAGALAAPSAVLGIKGISGASKALADYQKQVLATGPGSKASAQSLHEYNMALQAAPQGTKRFLHSRTQLGQEFGRATQPGQAAVAGIGTRGVNLARQLTPTIAPLSNRFLQGAQGQADNFADFLNDSQSRDFYKAMGKEATADLTQVEGIGENVVRTMENIARAGRPFFHEGLVFLDHWTEGWKKSTNDLKGTRSEIGEFADDLKAWGKLGSSTFDLGKDLLGAGRKPGTNMVGDLTKQVEVWDEFIVKHPREVKQFFDNAVSGTEKIAGAVGKITKLLWETGKALTPLLEQGTQLVGVLDHAGLLSPGGLPFLIAGGAGVRNATGRFRGRVTGTTGGTAGGSVIVPGGAPAPVTGAGRYGSVLKPGEYGTAYGLEREAGAGRLTSAGRVLGGTRAASGAAAFGRGFVGRLGPTLAISAGIGALTTQGNIWERLRGGASSATFGAIPPPETDRDQFSKGYRWSLDTARDAQIVGHRNNMTPNQIRQLEIRTIGGPRLSGYKGDDPEQQGVAAGAQARIGEIRNARTAGGIRQIEDLQGALGVNLKHGVSGARGQAISGVGGLLASTHNTQAARAIGEGGLGLAHELAQENPKLKGAVNDLAETIEKRFEEMGRKVQVIHGRIVDVSAASWDQVAKDADSKTQQALASTTKNLTALEHRAMSILRNMGFSPGVARQLAQQSLQGGEAGNLANSAANAGTATAEVNGHLDPHFLPGRHGGKHNATGGSFRISGQGLHDTVNLGGGNMAAPGEALIANRHTERRIDRMLGGFGTSLGREIQNEGRAHSEQFRTYSATGSIMPAGKLAQSMGLSVSGGPGFGGVPSSGHVGDSLHYSGLAYDVSGSPAQMWAYRKRSERAFRGSLNELFYDPYPYYIDQGKKVPGSLGGHSDHVHIGFFPGGAKGSVAGMGGGGRAAGHPQVKLRGLKSGVGGLTGAIADSANQAIAGGMSRNLNHLIGGRGGGKGMGALPGGGGGSPQANMALARKMLGGFGWGPGEFSPLKSLWTQESGWSTTARNPSSGAYGIPQALPPSKMGSDAQGSGPAAARAQILWGLKYIKERYGSPAGAWGHEQSSNWYSRGGRVPGFAGWYAKGGHFRVKGPTLMGVGEAGEETVKITPKGRGRRGGGGVPAVHVTIGNVNVRHAHEAKAVGRKLGQGIAEELASALRDSDGTPERTVS